MAHEISLRPSAEGSGPEEGSPEEGSPEEGSPEEGSPEEGSGSIKLQCFSMQETLKSQPGQAFSKWLGYPAHLFTLPSGALQGTPKQVTLFKQMQFWTYSG